MAVYIIHHCHNHPCCNAAELSVCIEGTWLVSTDKVKLAAIPVATISCQMANIVLASMDTRLNSTRAANVTHRRQRKISSTVCLLTYSLYFEDVFKVLMFKDFLNDI